MYDHVIIGAGIAGASMAFELCEIGTVALIEAEAQPGYHSTGRSAALFTPNYGNQIVRRINALSAPFFRNPPEGFAEHPLLTPRGLLTIAPPGQEDGLESILETASDLAPVHRLSASQALSLAPLLQPHVVAAGVYEPGVTDIDVDALHQGYLRGLKARGGDLACGARVREIKRRSGHWQIRVREETIAARIVINAAGAWADEIGAMAGAQTIGLVPKRRSAIVVDAPDGIDIGALPAVETIGSEAYFKPEAGRIMASLGDETPTEPQDAQPEELDIALIADWLQRQTTIIPRRIEHSWAGLRSFVSDGAPVVGFDARLDDFFWLAAQGGYGIMMAPTLARYARSLIKAARLSDALTAHDILKEALSPARFAH